MSRLQIKRGILKEGDLKEPLPGVKRGILKPEQGHLLSPTPTSFEILRRFELTALTASASTDFRQSQIWRLKITF
jgi:hypothetical protein